MTSRITSETQTIDDLQRAHNRRVAELLETTNRYFLRVRELQASRDFLKGVNDTLMDATERSMQEIMRLKTDALAAALKSPSLQKRMLAAAAKAVNDRYGDAVPADAVASDVLRSITSAILETNHVATD